MNGSRIILVQTAIADYRDKFIEHCIERSESLQVDFKIFSGLEYFENTTRTSKYIISRNTTKVFRNLFILKRKVLLQALDYFSIFRADVVVCELNPRIINTWVTVWVRRLLGKRTVLWGHAWGRAGRGSKTEWLRNILRKSADALLLYTYAQKGEVIKHIGDGEYYVAPNSLYRLSDLENVYSKHSKSILYVGRLVSSKKVDFLVRSASLFIQENPEVVLEIVGDGTEKSNLMSLAKALGIEDKVLFHGHISDRDQLKTIYSRAFVSVSPGYVGLSITQSFSFGIPMLVSKHEAHSPELEALKENFNGDFFLTDNELSLRDMLHRYYQNREEYCLRSNGVVEDCGARYSVEKMVEGFYASIFGSKPR